MDKNQFERIRWACKRGMLELDLILEPFFRANYESFSSEDFEMFSKLLTFDDPKLYSWVLGNDQPLEEPLYELIQRIIAYHRTKTRKG